MLVDGSALSLRVIKSLVQQLEECSHFSFWAVSWGLAQTSPVSPRDVAVLVHSGPAGNTSWMGSPLQQGSRRLRLSPKILYHLPEGLGRRERLFSNSTPSHRQHASFKTIISWKVLAKKATDLQRKSYRWSCNEHQPPLCKSWDQDKEAIKKPSAHLK